MDNVREVSFMLNDGGMGQNNNSVVLCSLQIFKFLKCLFSISCLLDVLFIFQVLIAVSMKMAVFWVVVPGSNSQMFQRYLLPLSSSLIALIMAATSTSEMSANFYQKAAIITSLFV
jgi:hypothetical protein